MDNISKIMTYPVLFLAPELIIFEGEGDSDEM